MPGTHGGVSSANVNLPNLGLVTLTPAGVKVSASFAQLTGGANVVHPVAPGVSVFGSLAGDYKMHDHRQEFDQNNWGVAGGVSYLQEQNLFRGTLSFNTLNVDYRRFRNVTGFTGEWIRQIDELQAVSALVQYAELDYAGDNRVRDARLYGLGVGYRRAFLGPWRPLATVSASYTEEDNRRGRDDLAREIYGFRAAVAVTPAPRWSASAGATYQVSDYKTPDVLLAPFPRRDKYYALDATGSYAVTRNLSIRGELLLSKNESNIALYEYKREVASIKVRYEFK
ncbi:MAG: DUF560 domain-containing protein [Betaproteobacteria bacterium]|nr:DUF560 domain-containing protein [Betaproteobacteria bacterium]